jgi:exonuclease SbcC
LDDAERALKTLETALNNAVTTANQRKGDVEHASEQLKECGKQLTGRLAGSAFSSVEALRASKLEAGEAARLQKEEEELKAGAERLGGSLDTERKRIAALREAKAAEGEAVAGLESNIEALQSAIEEIVRSIDRLEGQLQADQINREQHAPKAAQLEQDRKRLHVWRQLQGLIGSADGAKFRRYAQGISLDLLLRNGNEHLKGLSDRYRLQRQSGEELELRIEDLYQAGATRPMASLSGGESFLASLALALGLADLAGRNVRIDSLFIDEGFGALDAETLDLAISTLETLRQDNKTVGVISHVDLLKERIGTRIVVEKHSGGTSILRIAS